MFPLARKNNIGIIARVPLDEGSLSGTFTTKTTFNDWRKDYFTPDRMKVVVKRVNAMKRELISSKRTMAQIALKYSLLENSADVAIVGMRSPNHVEENLKSLDIRLSKKEIRFLDSQRWIRNFYPEDV